MSNFFLKENNFVNQIELAVRFGKILIVEEIDKVEPVLYNILRNDKISQGKKVEVKVKNEEEINWIL